MNRVVLLSGGLDSAVVLAHCLTQDSAVKVVFVYYGQSNADRERSHAALLARHYGLRLHCVNLNGHFEEGSANAYELPVRTLEEIRDQAPSPAIVPGRNLMLIGVAAMYAQRGDWIYIGSNADDCNFPDCSPQFASAACEALLEGYGVSLVAPLENKSKDAVVEWGRQLKVPFDFTWSCYRGGDNPCGVCDACVIREDAGA